MGKITDKWLISQTGNYETSKKKKVGNDLMT